MVTTSWAARVKVCAAAIAMASLLPPSASADDETMLVIRPMTVVGINDDQAAKAGNVVRIEGTKKLLIDGRTGELLARVPANLEVAQLDWAHAVAPLATEHDPRREHEGSTEKSRSTMQDAQAVRPPRGAVAGNCGTSHIYLRDVPQNDIYQFETGFNVFGDAYDFAWKINIHSEDDSGTYNFDWDDNGPMWPNPEWTTGWKDDNTDKNAYHTARVTSGTAWLTDGRVCFSGYPTDTVYVS